MPEARWRFDRILFIWCAWPTILVVAIAVTIMGGTGLSIDLIHLFTSPIAAARVFGVLLGPPILATLLWGRRRTG